MNGSFPYTSSWIGSLGEYSIYEYLNQISKNSSNYTSNTSNTLETHLYNTSNILQAQITATGNIIHTDSNSNVIVRLIAQNPNYPYYPLTETPIEMLFQTTEGEVKTKITQSGELMVYHPAGPLPAGFSPGWWGVENKIANVITDTQGLRFDVTNLQAATGATAITNSSTASAAVAGAAAGVAAATATTAAAGATIANGDYGTVALGVAGGALFSVLGYLSYQAQRESNLTSNGFTSEAAQIHNNIITANGLVADNIGNIVTAKGFVHSNMLFAQNYISSNTVANLYVSSNVLSNLSISKGFINSNITTQQYISNLKCDTLNLNSGNIANINGISTNELIANGKIKQNGVLLDNTYLTSNHLYNLSLNYTAERQYPPKAYTTSSPETTVSLLNKQVYKQTLYLDSTSISYGSGYYEIYSSSTYDNGITNKDKLFNHTAGDIPYPRWAISLYNSGSGQYIGDNSIDGSYFGDWVIIKLQQPILLTRYRIFQSPNSPFPEKAPAEWKCYGSNDGITFTEITQASQMTRLTSYTSGYYQKTVDASFTTLYQWFGFTFNKLLSVSGHTDLSFAELRLYGKEIISNSITSQIYTTSNIVKGIIRNEMSDIPKRKMFIVSIPSSSTFVDATSSTTFYKWDLDLRNYTTTQIIPSVPYTGDLLRVFKISLWYIPSYFGSYINGEPYVINYTVYMSNKSNPIFGKPETAGVNIYAVGFPENIKLANILPNNIMLLKNYNSNFNYLTIVSRQAPADLYVIIEDQLF